MAPRSGCPSLAPAPTMAPWSMPPSYWKNCFPAMNRCSRDAYVLSTGPGVPPMEKNETNTNSHAYEAERRVRHFDNPGLRNTDFQAAPGQSPLGTASCRDRLG